MGFFEEEVNVLRVIELRTTFGIEPNIKKINALYLVVDSRAPYHMILRRPSLNTLEAVVSTPHLALKFPISAIEIGVVQADQKESRQCYHDSLRKNGKETVYRRMQEVHMVETNQNKNINIRDLDPREEGRARPEPDNEL